ncbi:MAG: hypothetical protein KatS3mg124_1066 [Porticoccaceae bacterium]|nr:MAG: hypothetical protein KatS3mg124_1066 [Porticoccaceae bacterium]
MYLDLDEGERAVSEGVAAFLAGEFPLQRLLHSSDSEALEAFAAQGWLGLAVPEELGGAGLSCVEEALFFMAHGREAGPFDLFPQMLALEVARHSPTLVAELLSAVHRVALWVATEGETARLVASAPPTVALRIEVQRVALWELKGKELSERTCLDRSVSFYLVPRAELRLLAEERCDLYLRAELALASMEVGIAQRALEMIVAYARQRHTFGRPIGAYQAVRHPCADMAVRVEAARCQLYYAACALREGHRDAATQVSAARVLARRAARDNTDLNIQLHGGLGVTEEYPAHLLLKRANLLARLPGGRSWEREALLQESA